MMITSMTVTLYQTSDGETFDSMEAAKDHEAVLSLVSELGTSDIYWRDTSPQEVAEWVLDNYILSKK